MGRIIKTSFQHFGRNKGLAFASIIVMALTFFISTIFLVTFWASNITLTYLETQLPVVVVFKPTSNIDQAKIIQNDVKAAFPKAAIDYCDQNCAIDQFKRANPNDSFNLDSVPPYLSIGTSDQKETEKIYNYLDKLIRDIVPKTQENSIAKDATKYLKDKDTYYVIKSNYDYIYSIDFNLNAANIFKDIRNLVQYVGIGISVILLLVSFIIISITISMTIFTMRKEIQIMELVGATRFFIRAPFVIDGALFGVIGAGFATIIFLGGMFAIVQVGNESALIPALKNYFGDAPWPQLQWWSYMLMVGGEMAVGGLIGAVSSFFSSGKYLK